MRTRPCTADIRQGRLDKAKHFIEAAGLIREYAAGDGSDADAYVQLCVLAGIAAGDAICCAGLGVHAKGESHNEAVDLLAKVDKNAAKHLAALLGLKTKSGYGHTPATRDDCKRAGRAAEALVERAQRAKTSTS
jgi:dihydropteroate synthase